jgi:hypothetical protein
VAIVCAMKGAVMGGGGVPAGCIVCAAVPATTLVNPRFKDKSHPSAHLMMARC